MRFELYTVYGKSISTYISNGYDWSSGYDFCLTTQVKESRGHYIGYTGCVMMGRIGDSMRVVVVVGVGTTIGMMRGTDQGAGQDMVEERMEEGEMRMDMNEEMGQEGG